METWFCVDKDGDEKCFNEEPYREDEFEVWESTDRHYNHNPFIILPKGSIEKIIGKKLTWEDNAYCICDEEI